jgi:hypothetical protein
VDRYSQPEFNETRFRAICVEMSMLFLKYYATSRKPPLLQRDRRNHLFPIFIIRIDPYFKYLSTGFYFVLFDSELVAIFNFLNYSN